MSVAQWAPWVSVFLGGCLSGAALLSLSSDPPVDARRAVTAPPESPPAHSAEQTEAAEVAAHEAESATEHDVVPSDTAAAEPADPEAGPSAADILAALEQAYQRQVAEAVATPEAETPPTDAPATLEVEAATALVETVPVEAAPAPSLTVEREAQAVAADDTPDVAVDEGAGAPQQVAAAARAEPDQAPIQQIAVLYQPVYVLPPGNPVQQTTTPAPRAIGRDPWAPLTISPRHNPWGAVGVSSGVWAAGNVAGGVWAAGFTAGP